MILKKIFFIFFYCLLVTNTFSQSNKSVDFGISIPLSTGRIQGLALSPNINYCSGKHQFQIGLDFYYYGRKGIPKILGSQLAYKYLLRNETKKFNVFVDFNLQYVQYANGTVEPVPYYYLPTEEHKIEFNLIQTKSFINTLGLGLSTTLFNRATFIFVISGGYNYYQSKYSPTNTDNYGIYLFDVGEKAIPIIYTRIGLNYKIWKNYSKNVSKPIQK